MRQDDAQRGPLIEFFRETEILPTEIFAEEFRKNLATQPSQNFAFYTAAVVFVKNIAENDDVINACRENKDVLKSIECICAARAVMVFQEIFDETEEEILYDKNIFEMIDLNCGDIPLDDFLPFVRDVNYIPIR